MASTAVALCFGVATLAVGPLPARAEPDATPGRLAGPDRVATAAALAQPSGTAVLASARTWPDALAAAGLVAALDATLLLTEPDHVPAATAEVLQRSGASRVVLLGGQDAIGTGVADALAASGLTVERIAGVDRFATAAAVATAVATAAGPPPIVFIASGEGFADALAAGAVAYDRAAPVLLTAAETLTATAAQALSRLEPARTVVLGGTGAVSDRVLEQIAATGTAVERVGGATRDETAVALADWQEREAQVPVARVLLVRGDDPTDALAAGPYAGRNGAAVLLLAEPRDLGDATTAWLAARCGRLDALQAVGGTSAVAPSTLDLAWRAARVCDPAAAAVTFEVAVAVDPDAGRDAPTFAGEVIAVLSDLRGWPQPGRLGFAIGGEGADLVVHLTTAQPCTPSPACRSGQTLSLHADAWAGASADERARLVNDLVGHWLGQDHLAIPPWPTPGEKSAVLDRYAPQVTIAAAGDVHGQDEVRAELLAGRNPLDPVAPLLSAADIALVNLETAVGSSGSPADKTYTFQAPPQLVSALKAAGVDVVNLANNHALDYGVGAIFETLALAREAGLLTVGAGRDAAEAYAPALIEAQGRTVAIVGLSRVLSGGWAATASRPGLASAYDEPAAVAAVQRAAEQADLVVVAIHWGIELAECPDANQRRLAVLLTDAGADLVAGHHPHILQGIQQRGDATVAYSLGNFVWYHNRAPSRFTGVLTAALPGGPHTFSPAEIDGRGSPRPVSGAAAEAILGSVVARSPGGARCAF